MKKSAPYYWIAFHPYDDQQVNILLDTAFDKERFQKVFDTKVVTLSLGDGLEYGKFDGETYHSNMLYVEMGTNGLKRATPNGKWVKYTPKYLS